MKMNATIAFRLCCCVLLLVSLMFLSFFKVKEPWKTQLYEQPRRTDNLKMDGLLKQIVVQRNQLSVLLNKATQKFLKLECETNKGKVSSSGGWCKHTSTATGGYHVTDNVLIKGLSKFLKGFNVASFGDGPGMYKKGLDESGITIDAYDGAPFCEETSEGRVNYLDLSIPQYGLPMYDWIMSLEVAEHIPRQYESIYLDNIARYAQKGVILSWAVPGQGGTSHVNNRPLSHVITELGRRGFVLDEKLSKLIKTYSSVSWLKQNTNVYIRKTDAKYNLLG